MHVVGEVFFVQEVFEIQVIFVVGGEDSALSLNSINKLNEGFGMLEE